MVMSRCVYDRAAPFYTTIPVDLYNMTSPNSDKTAKEFVVFTPHGLVCSCSIHNPAIYYFILFNFLFIEEN